MNFADISHHQGVVDLAKYKAAGHDRIIMKATQGVGFTDPMFKTNWQNAGKLGLKRVAYCYAEAQNNGGKDFDYLLDTVNAAGGLKAGDWLCLDVEDVNNGQADYNRAQYHVREFTARAVARGVKNGLIYTGRWYANPAGVDPSDCQPGWRKLWISHYDQSVPDGSILLPTGWTRDQVVARQYTDRATVAGVSGWCDYSRVLKDWTTAVEAVSTDKEDWLAMASMDDVKTAVRQVLNEGTGDGQRSWAGTEKAELGTEQANFNLLNEINGKLDKLLTKLGA
jgi:GH25 family lysozyme M1 (1,4-beta-N-acetylmuramidase)